MQVAHCVDQREPAEVEQSGSQGSARKGSNHHRLKPEQRRGKTRVEQP